MPLTAPVAAVISSGMSAAGGVAGNIKNYNKSKRYFDYTSEKNYQYDQQAAAAAHGRQIDLYNREFGNNLHTSDPKFQANRLKAAGFNPALMYGDLQGMPGTSVPGSAGTGSASPGESGNFNEGNIIGNALNQGMEFSLLRSQREAIDARAAKDRADARATNENLDNPVYQELLKASLTEALQNIENKKIQQKGLELDNSIKETQVWLDNQTAELKRDEVQWRFYRQVMELENLWRQMERDEKMEPLLMEKALADISETWASVALKNAQTAEEKAKAERWKKEFDEKIRQFNESQRTTKRGQDNSPIGFARDAAAGILEAMTFGQVEFHGNRWDTEDAKNKNKGNRGW